MAPTEATTRRCLRVVEVAEQLAVSRQAVYELIDRGALECVHIGRRKVVTTEALNAFIAAGGTS